MTSLSRKRLFIGSRAALLTAWVLMSACSTVNSRIEDNHEKFSAYPPEIQAQIQNGQVSKGFTEDMVFLARGKPDEKSAIKRKGKTIDLWKYALPYGSPVGSEPGPTGAGLSSPYGYPVIGQGRPSHHAGAASRATRAYFIVEFENNIVTGWQGNQD